MVGDMSSPHGWRRLLTAALAVMVALAVAGPILVGAGDEDADAKALLDRAVTTMNEIESFHFELTTERGESVILEGLELQSAVGDVQRPDRFWTTVTASIAIATLDVTVVGVGSQLWVSDPTSRDGRFIEIDTGAEIETLLNPDLLLLAAVAMVQDPTIIGEDELDGVETTEITGTVNFGQMIDQVPEELLPVQQMPIHVWIDENGRVVQLELDGPLTRSDSSDIVRRLTLSDFDEDFDIQPPNAS